MTCWCRVIKVGGSLLDWRAWQEHFRAWLATQEVANNVVLVGGGARVETLRTDWGAGELNDQAAHWQAIRAMSDNARLVTRAFPDWTYTEQLEVVRQACREQDEMGRTWLLDPERYLTSEDPYSADGPLPEGWEVTSDSIAARVCECLGAGELVLVKSCLPEGGAATLDEWAELGYVDPYFPRAGRKLPLVRCVNLRTRGYPNVLVSSL